MTKPHQHPKSSELHGFFIPADTDLPMGMKVIPHNLREVQNLVGGYLEQLFPNPQLLLECGCPIVMLADEDGLPHRLPQNLRASTLRPSYHPVVGDVFILGSTTDNWFSLPQAFAQWEGPGASLPENQKQPWEQS